MPFRLIGDHDISVEPVGTMLAWSWAIIMRVSQYGSSPRRILAMFSRSNCALSLGKRS